MLEFKPSTDYKQIREILTQPLLFELSLGKTISRERYVVDTAWKYILVLEDNEIIGLIGCKDFTKTTLEAHLSVIPKYWRTTKSSEILKEFEANIKEKGYKVIFCPIPAQCTHVLKCAERNGYLNCGSFKDGIIFDNRLQTLFLYSKNL